MSSDEKIGIKDTNGTVKFLLSSGPVAWLLLGIGVLTWGMKLESKLEAHKEQTERRINNLEINSAQDAIEHREFAKDIIIIEERQQSVIKRLDKLDNMK